MMDYGRRMLKAMQPAFSRRAAFAWFGAGGREPSLWNSFGSPAEI